MQKYRIRPLRLEKGWSQEQLATSPASAPAPSSGLKTVNRPAGNLDRDRCRAGRAGQRSQCAAATGNGGRDA